MNKAHIDINWENYPSDETPLNERIKWMARLISLMIV